MASKIISYMTDEHSAFIYWCDSVADIDELPTSPFGSKAMIHDTGEIYALDSTGTWRIVPKV